jgi:hypothetical protein
MKKMPKNAEIFYCEKCDFTCSKQSNYEKHLLTAKHKNRTILNEKMPKNAEYVCECGKTYMARNSLWYHKKKCNYINEDVITNEIEIMKKNKVDLYKELLPLMKDMMTEIAPVIQPHNTTTNNQNFNINIFLNEECKDAMNITDFIESIQLSIEDMIKIGKQGQTQGISNILIDKLNSLDVVKRPMHCSDIKKETIYIKDEDKWQKENSSKPKLINALDKLSVKSIKSLDTIENDPDVYIQTVNEVLKDPREDKKIISNIAKQVCL